LAKWGETIDIDSAASAEMLRIYAARSQHRHRGGVQPVVVGLGSFSFRHLQAGQLLDRTGELNPAATAGQV
jgi:hypothetical protein